MGWARLDDGYATHPKLLAAGLEATGLDARAISHCAKHETDGFVGDNEVASLAGDTRKGRKLGQVLEAVRRWHRSGVPCECLSPRAVADTRPGYWVHDFLKYNGSKERLKAIREADRIRKESERNPSGQKQESQRNPAGPSRERGRAPASRPPPVPTEESSSSNKSVGREPPDDDDAWAIAHDAAQLRLTASSETIARPEKWLVTTATDIYEQHHSRIQRRLSEGAVASDIAAELGPKLPTKPVEPTPGYHEKWVAS